MMFKKCILFIFIIGAVSHAPSQCMVDNTLSSTGTILEKSLIGASVLFSGIIVHKYGRAFAKTLMYGEKMHIPIINIDITHDQFMETLHSRSSGYLMKKAKSKPYVQICEKDYKYQQKHPIKEIFIAASGPMAGMLFGAYILQYSNGNALWKYPGAGCIALHMCGLIPYCRNEEDEKSESDGYKIMKNLGFGKEQLKIIATFTNHKYFFAIHAAAQLSITYYFIAKKL